MVTIAMQDNTSLYELIGELDLQNRHYFILSLRDGIELDRDKILSAVGLLFPSELEVREIVRFQVGERICLLAESIAIPPESPPDIAKRLTKREQQIATLVALGRVNKQIANQLGIGECTVATYLSRIFAKLGVDSRAAMVYRCAPLIQHLRDRETNVGR
ncbi:MAG: helix-turn-helix transcriptional regulator [Cyanosarcina radialis HA8281-LM2]|jgi:DNA-binding CsgD family transcriptional regulator|nr:helix-turn-helix transcriptional regulator [Cyanosarcina radialis HA8281-LM2]